MAGYYGTPLARKLGPKRAAKLPGDVSEDVVREIALPLCRREGRRGRRGVADTQARHPETSPEWLRQHIVTWPAD